MSNRRAAFLVVVQPNLCVVAGCCACLYGNIKPYNIQNVITLHLISENYFVLPNTAEYDKIILIKSYLVIRIRRQRN